jgi:hypothetical protein
VEWWVLVFVEKAKRKGEGSFPATVVVVGVWAAEVWAAEVWVELDVHVRHNTCQTIRESESMEGNRLCPTFRNTFRLPKNSLPWLHGVCAKFNP